MTHSIHTVYNINTMKTKEKITALINETLKEYGFNQEQLDAALGISRQSVNYWINGKAIPKYGTIAQLRKNENLWVRDFAVRLTMILVLE